MKSIRNILGLIVFLIAFVSCEKTEYSDLSFLETVQTPSNINPFFNITQDNTGRVTITPNGEGATAYDIYFGHGASIPNRVAPGASITHTYPEGVYNVRSVGIGITGKSIETTKQLTVTFRAPENLVVTATKDANNNYKINVSATAAYETLFNVYFGDVTNEVPQKFLEGETVSHTYTKTGSYTLRVVALSGGVATTESSQTINIYDPLLLPLTFQSTTLNYAFTNFDGGVVTIENNPYITGINTSTKVAKMVKTPGQTWAGSYIVLSSPISFTSGKIFRMKVYSPRVGARVLFKIEGAGGLAYEQEATTTLANSWEDLVFDYSAVPDGNYTNIVLIFDNGLSGDGSANYTFYFDDIRLTNTLDPSLPIDFQSSLVSYSFTDFGGAGATVVDNPSLTGINTSSKVGKMIKYGGEVWAGSFLTLENPVDITVKKIFKVKVFAPKVGTLVKLKLDGTAGAEVDAVTTVANSWQELTFDFTGKDVNQSYTKVVLFFDFGLVGDGSADFTYYFDDIKLN